MDDHLYQVWGQRPAKLRWDDTPVLARTLVDVIEGTGRVHRYSRGDHDYIVLVSGDTTLVILGSDWQKIAVCLPNNAAGVSPALFSKGAHRPIMTTTVVPRPIDTPAELRDPPLYDTLLVLLQGLFPERFPTSKL